MAEQPQPQAQPQSGGDRKFSIQKIFIKDISFETPNSPAIFQEAWAPKVNLNMTTDAKHFEKFLYEVSLAMTITVTQGDKTAYLVEVQQSGLFSLEGFPQQEMGPMLGSFCPNILFPYSREVVSDLVTKGGFPPMLLAPVNFDALYAQHMQKLQQQQKQPSPPASTAIN